MVIDFVRAGIGVAIVLATTTVLWMGYSHYTGLLEAKSVLQADVKQLELALDVEKLTVLQLSENAKEWARAQEATRDALAEQTRIATAAREEVRRLDEIFSRHDLGKLARGKPDLVERRLNDGTAHLFRMFECASGASGCEDR